MNRRKPLKRGGPLKRTPLKRRSDKGRALDAIYTRKRKRFLAENRVCLARFQYCTSVAEQVHHMNGRLGKNYLDETTWAGVCASCHAYIHDHPNTARERGLLK